MRKNGGKKGNLNQKSKHKMRTTDGMIEHARGDRKRELTARRGGYNPPKPTPKGGRDDWG